MITTNRKTVPLKLGHQAPVRWRVNKFNSINIKGDFAYCSSHNFVYNKEIEQEKLYNALPCYYTDIRFRDSSNNFYGECKLHWTRFTDVSLRACIRKTLNCKNIPVGTIVEFHKSWYYPGKKVDNSFKFKIRKENKLDIEFEINDPDYKKNFASCEFSKNLTDALRLAGFIVGVRSENTNFLSSMISTAAAYTGKYIETKEEEGESAIAYGFGKKIGYSSKNDSLFGYSSGCDNILFDWLGEFDKWSRCNEISKTTSIDEIVEILKSEKKED